MNETKWRVATFTAPAWDTLSDKETVMRVWGVWPPLWPMPGPPLLMYRAWVYAWQAACDRAQFANSPPPPQPIERN